MHWINVWSALFCNFPLSPRAWLLSRWRYGFLLHNPTIINFDFIWGFLCAHTSSCTFPHSVLVQGLVYIQQPRDYGYYSMLSKQMRSASQLLPSLPCLLLVSSLLPVISLWPDIAILSLLAFSETGNRRPHQQASCCLDAFSPQNRPVELPKLHLRWKNRTKSFLSFLEAGLKHILVSMSVCCGRFLYACCGV